MIPPTDPRDLLDPYMRGKVNMFVKMIELANRHPNWEQDDFIEAVYAEVKDECDLDTIFQVRVKGTVVTERPSE